jgi:hypothetical protein
MNPWVPVCARGAGMRRVVIAAALLAGVGCQIGPRAVTTSRLEYNEAVKVTSEEQLLLNIVRLRYGDTPSSLGVSGIADQREVSAGLSAVPFFTSDAGGLSLGGYRGALLPAPQVSGASRPTLSYTPQDDAEFTRRLFTPITLDGIAYLGKTTWPISTVFRLYLENLNWVPNAETVSGPTPPAPPEYAEFLAGVRALQRLQDRKAVTLFLREGTDPQGDPVPADKVTAAAQVDAAQTGMEYRRTDGGMWQLVKPTRVPVLRLDPAAVGSADHREFARAFRLDPSVTAFDLTVERTDPYLAGTPPAGLATLDLEPRSLLQSLYFVAHGVEVPPAHAAAGVAPLTVGPDGTAFDYQQVLGGLFKVCWACGKRPPAGASVAVKYHDYWFYIDAADRDTRATFALLLEMSRLELGPRSGAAPLLTLPLGGS